MKYNKSKFKTLVDIILDKNNGDISLRKDAIMELKNNALTHDILSTITRSERLYGDLPEDLQGLVDFKNKQRTDDVVSMLVDAGENLNISTLDDFCLYLGIPADSSSAEITDKAHVVMRAGRKRQPRAVSIV